MASAIESARHRCQRPDWTFGTTDGIHIPLMDGVADFACFFSVFTHVTHEHTYLYLKEAHRLLRPGGLVVLTFLEFAIPSHWSEFEQATMKFGLDAVSTVFLDRVATKRFAGHLGFEVLALVDGDTPTFPIDEEIHCSNGHVMKERGFLGQSLGVLR